MLSIYVDGSFIDGICGYGAVIIKDDKIIEKIGGSLSEKEYTAIRQVAGELFAVMKAVEWCISGSITEIDIYYDYKGIECWATGEWKAKNTVTKKYSEFIRKCGIKIRWHKVEAHSGNRWNDEADKLAKFSIKTGKMTVINNIESDIEKFCNKFMDYIDYSNYYSVFAGVFNGMYGRIEILDEANSRIGIIDIYKTARKNFTPDFRSFKDHKAEKYIISLFESSKPEILKLIS